MRKVLVITGPTASGKTAQSINVVLKLNGEIISADSRQIYKHMPVSTSQPSEDHLRLVKHHFISILEPDQGFNAGEFGIKGREIIEDIFSRGKVPVITGGSGLYIRSLIDGFFEEISRDQEVREKLYHKLETEGEASLYEELKDVDRETYNRIPKGKIRRVIRALEIFHSTGKKISEHHKEKIKINFETVQTGLLVERNILYDRINERVDEMIEAGLLDEVRNLMEKGFHYKKNYPVDTVGVKEVMKFFEGEYGQEEMLRLIKQNTRRYAKRQMTWFRNDERINWIESSSGEDLSDKIIGIFKKE